MTASTDIVAALSWHGDWATFVAFITNDLKCLFDSCVPFRFASVGHADALRV